MSTTTAWDLIGFGGEHNGQRASVRIVGGRTLYEAVDSVDNGRQVRLARLDELEDGGFRQVNRFVAPDTAIEVVLG